MVPLKMSANALARAVKMPPNRITAIISDIGPRRDTRYGPAPGTVFRQDAGVSGAICKWRMTWPWPSIYRVRTSRATSSRCTPPEPYTTERYTNISTKAAQAMPR
jgi:hypothetical protein